MPSSRRKAGGNRGSASNPTSNVPEPADENAPTASRAGQTTSSTNRQSRRGQTEPEIGNPASNSPSVSIGPTIVDLKDVSTTHKVAIKQLILNVRNIFPSFKAYQETSEFIFAVIQQIIVREEIVNPSASTSVISLPPFHLLALYYFKEFMFSKLFQAMSERAFPTKIDSAMFYGQKLPTKHRFYCVIWHKPKTL